MHQNINQGEVLDSTTSTQTELKDRLLQNVDLPNYYFIQASVQSQGRGRQGREWVSENGNLFLSVLLRGPLHNITWIPHHVGFSILKTFFNLGVKEDALKIKWPNDIIDVTSSPAKIAGLIVEKVGNHFILGVGINILTAPKVNEQNTSSLKDLISEVPSLEKVRNLFLKNLSEPINLSQLKNCFEKYGFFKKGDAIQFGDEKAKVEGIGEFGELLVRMDSGIIRPLFSEDVHLVKN